MKPPINRSSSHPSARLLSALAALTFAPSIYAQSPAPASPATTPAPAALPPEEETIQLSIFEVSSARDYGYRAANALSATGTGMEIKDTPVTVNVVTREFLDDIGTANIKDALQYVPGVNTNARFASSTTTNTAFVVRGFTPGLRSEFGSSGLAFGGDFIERVEVMKGPNAIFFGRVAPGGVINRISKQPQFTQKTTTLLQYGSYDYKKASVDVTGPIGPYFAYRVIGYVQDQGDGYNDFTGERGKGVKADLLFRPWEDTTVRLQVSAEEQKIRRIHSPARTSSAYLRICAPGGVYDPSITFNGIPCSQAPSAWVQNQNNIIKANNTATGRRDPNLYYIDSYYTGVHPRGRRAHFDGPDAFLADKRSALFTQVQHRFNEIFSAKAEYNYSENTFEYLNSSWFPRPDGVSLNQASAWSGSLPAPTWSAEAELVSEFKIGATSHRLLFGAEQSEAETRTWSQTRPALTFNFASGQVYRLASNPATIRTANTNYGWSETRGYYGVGVSRFFSDRLTLLYGARDTRVATGTNGLETATGTVTRRYSKTGAVASDLTLQGGVVYKLTEDVSLFAGYGETFEPQTSISFDGSRLGPVSGKGKEIGVKSEYMDGKLSSTISLFNNERSGIANRDFGKELTLSSQPWFIAGGDETSEGTEIEVFYSPIRNYQAVVGYTWLWEAETTANKENFNLVGRGLQFTPKHTFSFWNRYTFTQGFLKRVTIGGGFRYNGKHEALSNLDWFKIINPSWHRFDAMVGYEFKIFGQKSDLQVNIENLTNEYYYDGEYTAARPLTVMARLRFSF